MAKPADAAERGGSWLDERASQAQGREAAAPDAAPFTDAANAERLVRRYGDDLLYVAQWGWVAWTGTHWARDELRARAFMIDTARAILHEAAHADSKQAQNAIVAWANKSQNAARIASALWCAQPALAARVEDFDQQPMLLPVANGTIDLRSGELHEHQRRHRCTRIAPVYYEPSARAPTWEAFLARVLPDDDVRAFVQRLAGYCLTGLTSEQVLAFLYGQGRNGKSVFLETLATLFGDYHNATRMETLSVNRDGGIPNDIAALAGARLVTVSETPEGSRVNESLIKDLTGGDTITARFLRHEFFEFRPRFTLWIRGNHKPQIRGTDDGIWRRVMLVPFNVQIPAAEVDPSLPEKLHGELAGILNWAIAGCLYWQRDGLQPPASVTEAVREYRTEMDTLGEFIDERCVLAPDAEAKAGELYHAYRGWCVASGHHPVSNTRFGLALAERGFRKVKSGTVRWRGIGLDAERCAQCDGESCEWCGDWTVGQSGPLPWFDPSRARTSVPTANAVQTVQGVRKASTQRIELLDAEKLCPARLRPRIRPLDGIFNIPGFDGVRPPRPSPEQRPQPYCSLAGFDSSGSSHLSRGPGAATASAPRAQPGRFF